MRLHEHGNHVVLGEVVLVELLLPTTLVLLLVLSLQLLGTAAVVPREPADIGEEILHVGEYLPLCFLSEVGELPSLMVVPEFEDGDCGDVVEVEDAVDLDPLETYEVVVGGELGGEVVPDVLGDEVVLVLGEGQLHLQSPLLLVQVQDVLHHLQRHPVLLVALLHQLLQLRKGQLQGLQRCQLLLLLLHLESELNRPQLI